MNITPEMQETAKEIMSFITAASRKVDNCHESLGTLIDLVKVITEELEAQKTALEALFENDDTLGKRDDVLRAMLESHADKANNMGLAIESLELKLNN